MFSLLFLIVSPLAIVRANILTTAQGILRGVNSEDGSYVVFNGIPYAGDPSKQRFRRAPPAPAWQGIREADHERAECIHSAGGNVLGEEDCLFLNIYVPDSGLRNGTARGSLRPVMFWLHGGGFTSGAASAKFYNPRHFVRRGIIMVAVNYRLGPLGFLCLGSEKATGNAGVKDALLALRWVRDNIIAFGGDAARVTVVGQSSGAAITETLVLSPTSEGLINRAILQSGTALNAWAFNYDAEERAQTITKYFTESSDFDDMAESLLKASTKELLMKSRGLNFPYFPFGICAEKDLGKEERLLGSPPMEILSSKRFRRVPMLIGYNSNEAYVLTPTLLRAKVSSRARRALSAILPEELRFFSESERQQVTERIRKAYFLDGNFSITKMLDYYTEAYFSAHIARSAKLHAIASDLPVYLYEFTRSSNRGIPEVDGVKKRGPAHSDELAYLFAGEDLDENEREVGERLATMWANFIEHGNPTPATPSLLTEVWEPLKGKELKLYVIGSELKMLTAVNDMRLRIWEDIYEKYYYRRISNPQSI